MDNKRHREKPGLTDQVAQVAEPLCLAENFELVHVEQAAQNRETLIRVYVDRPGGITLDDCVYISRQLGDLLDIHIPDLGSYRLEVSSPGLARPLFELEHFERFKGSKVKLKTRTRIENRHRFTGVLGGVEENQVLIEEDGTSYRIPFEEIDSAKVVPEF